MSHTDKSKRKLDLQNSTPESAAPVIAHNSLSTMDAAGAPPCRNFVTEMESRICALRDIYKEDVQKTSKENEMRLLQKRRKMQQDAGTKEILLDYTKKALQLLQEQRHTTEVNWQHTLAHTESLSQQLGAQDNAQTLSLTKSAMNQLLGEIKRNK